MGTYSSQDPTVGSYPDRERPSAPGDEDPHADLLAMLRDITGRDPGSAATGADGADGTFGDLGLSSMDLVELATRLDRRYGIELGTRPGDLEATGRLDTLVTLVMERRQR